MKREELIQTLTRMQKETTEGKLSWELIVQTTEGNDEKCMVTEDGEQWSVDECYTSFSCNYRNQEFCLITYEMIKTSKEATRTINYVFLPPLGIRLFSLQTLIPYSIEADRMLLHQIHTLWELLTKKRKENSSQVSLSVTESQVKIEE